MSEKERKKVEPADNAEETIQEETIPETEEPVVEEASSETPETPEKSEAERETEELKKQVAEYKDKWLRNVAEFDNYKKRNARLWQEAFNEGISSVVVKILPVGDNLDRALDLGLDEKTQEGIKAIKRKYDETLKGMDIEEIDPAGEPFDPNVAEAVMQVDKGEGDTSDTVKQVFEKGYRLKDKVIRYAKVSVIK